MKRALLALWLLGTIVYTTNGASTQYRSLETASIQSEQAEVHSVVVDTCPFRKLYPRVAMVKSA